MKTKSLLFLIGATLVLGTICAIPAYAGPISIEVFATFDYPGADRTVPETINEAGDISGLYTAEGPGRPYGFVRFADGTFSDPISEPNSPIPATFAYGMNKRGVVSGYYGDNDAQKQDVFHGFFYFHDAYTEFDVPGATDTFITGINDTNDFCGATASSDGEIQAYLDLNEVVIPIDTPGTTFTWASQINNKNEVVGYYLDGDSLRHGFFMGTDRQVRIVDFPAGSNTSCWGVNDSGIMVGTFVGLSGGVHSFIYKLGKEFCAIRLSRSETYRDTWY